MTEVEDKVSMWLNALSNPNVDRESSALLNQCLQNDLREYLNESKED